jgi:hypothetical protein
MHPEQLVRGAIIDINEAAEFLLGQYHDAENLTAVKKSALEKNTHMISRPN